MPETNWSLGENGAAIADVSNEATHVASSAANLLSAREDLLWITGDAPQHVTIELNRSHPPLLYAGWHVWHDYLTNPKTVELASGETPDALAPLIICQALPGEGTQVWRLPGAGIPSNHRFVRFRITETFGPGPTYMNNVVLLAADPGPNYQTSNPTAAEYTRAPTSAAAAGVPYPATSSPRGTAASRGLPPTWSRRDRQPYQPSYQPYPEESRHHDDGRLYEPLFRGPSPTAPVLTAAAGGRHGDDAVGIFRTTRGASAPGSARGLHRSVSSQRAENNNTGRMSQLLRDLDDDIKLLKPIKSVSPTKNMLLYVPQEGPQIPPLQLEDDFEDVDAGPQARSMSYRSGPSQPSRQHLPSHAAVEPSSSTHGAPPPPQQAPSQQGSVWPTAASSVPAGGVYYITQPSPQPAYTAELPKSYQDRLATLEQTVASLTQSVQHQREDLTMIKRLLLQQATERRRDAERRLQSEIAAPPPGPLPSAPQPSSTDAVAIAPATNGQPSSSSAHASGPRRAAVLSPSQTSPDPYIQTPPFTSQHVAVDFPEDALRGFVQSVMAEQIRKQAKKTESRVLHRLDEYLKDVVDSIANSVDDRVSARLGGTSVPPTAAASQGSAHAAPAASARKPSRRHSGGRPVAPENFSAGDPSNPISIVKDSSFDTSGSGAHHYRYT